MPSFQQLLPVCARSIVAVLITAVLWVQAWAIAPAQASERYITPSGEDITAFVNCLPEELSKGDLQRAIAESGNDYLERVFQLKENYSDYEISAAEKEFQACLKRNGIIPAAQANTLNR